MTDQKSAQEGGEFQEKKLGMYILNLSFKNQSSKFGFTNYELHFRFLELHFSILELHFSIPKVGL